MFDTDDEWDAAFAELAEYRHEAEKATAAVMARRRSVEREFRERARKLDERERLRRMAIRLAGQAGVKGIGRDAFTDRTKNQLLQVIREAEAVISRSQR